MLREPLSIGLKIYWPVVPRGIRQIENVIQREVAVFGRDLRRSEVPAPYFKSSPRPYSHATYDAHALMTFGFMIMIG
jgi:hypothetical protein